jgi:hypothetical protein
MWGMHAPSRLWLSPPNGRSYRSSTGWTAWRVGERAVYQRLMTGEPFDPASAGELVDLMLGQGP